MARISRWFVAALMLVCGLPASAATVDQAALYKAIGPEPWVFPMADYIANSVAGTGSVPRMIGAATSTDPAGYGTFGPSAAPGSSMFDFIANNATYHDNVLGLANSSRSYAQRNITCTFTAASAVVTGCSSTAGAVVGNYLQEQTNSFGVTVAAFGDTFPAGTKIASGLTGTGFTMSANAAVSGPRVISIVAQCGNAAIKLGTLSNGLPGDGGEMGAIGLSSPGDGCQGFGTGTRMGAAGNVIGYGNLYLESSNLNSITNYQYSDVHVTLTHRAGSDWYPGTAWAPLSIDGQTGDVWFADHLNADILRLAEANHVATLTGDLVIRQVTAGDTLLYLTNSTGTLSGQYYTTGGVYTFRLGNDSALYQVFSGFYSSSFKPIDYATSGGLEIGGTVSTSASHGYGLKVTTSSAKGAAYFNGNVANAAAVVTTPSTGGTVTFATNQALAIIEPAGTLATLTVTLPACTAAQDGDERAFLTTQIITTLTVGTAGGSVVGGSTSAAVGSGHKYHCVGGTTKWYQMN